MNGGMVQVRLEDAIAAQEAAEERGDLEEVVVQTRAEAMALAELALVYTLAVRGNCVN